MQNLRSALQKYLKGQLSTSGATFSRFAYAMPLAIAYVCALVAFADYSLPEPGAKFLAYAAIGGLAQITATALLVYIFAFKNFTVGTTFSKTETAQAAVFGLVVLGETVSPGAMVGIAVSLVGVVLISVTRVSLAPRDMLRQCLELPALVGLASGAFFGVSAVAYRAASLSLPDGDFIIRAALTLAVATTFQTLVMAVYMRIREPGQIGMVVKTWRVSSLVGLTGMLGSVGWLTAMTLQNAAYVRALGQIELLFTFAASYLFFKERASRNELVGIAFVSAGILLLILIR
jgi:drug/metabolite transporter (DMT)-like permease